MINTDVDKLFGLDVLDIRKDIILVEGPIDSLFLENSIAMAGSDVNVSGLPKEKLIYCFDNEPRNKEIVNKMEKVIDNGYRICIWNDNLPGKDINDLVMAGLDPEKIIRDNIYDGLTAKLKMTQWRR